MVVLILEKVSPSLRGELSRWMLEPFPGTFVGTLSAMVRDRLWERVCRAVVGKWRGAATMVEPADNEQGFRISSFGPTRRELVDLDGLQLVRIPPPDEEVVSGVEESTPCDWWALDASAWAKAFDRLLTPPAWFSPEDDGVWRMAFERLCPLEGSPGPVPSPPKPGPRPGWAAGPWPDATPGRGRE